METAAENLGPIAPGEPEGTDQAPQYRRLERSTSNRMFAGVAGGVAEYFSVDATFVRIAFVILSLFGGVGLVFYGAGWLLMPETGQPAAALDIASGSRRHKAALLLGALVIGIVIVSLLSNGPLWGIGGWRGGQKLGWFVVAGGLGYLVLRRFQPRIGTLPHLPHVPVRRILRRLALLCSGVVALVVLATFVALLVTGVSLRGGIGSKEWQPTSAAQLMSTYRAGIGNMTIDLSEVAFPDRTIHLTASVAIGRLVIEVPPGVMVSLDAHSGIGVVDYGQGGQSSFVDAAGVTSQPGGSPLLVLNAQAGIGQVQLVRSGSPVTGVSRSIAGGSSSTRSSNTMPTAPPAPKTRT